MGRELWQRKPPPWWERYSLPELGAELRAELQTPAACDRFLETILFNAGRAEAMHTDLVKWALEEGDESAVVLAHAMMQGIRDATNNSIADVRRYKSTIESRQERSVSDHEG